MSSRWPQGQQDQRSPYGTYDGSWSQDDASEEPWQDNGWQSGDQTGYGDQWPSAQGSARPAGRAAQAVAEQRAPERRRSRGRTADDFQSEWDQSGGGFGDDNDLEWISYLTGGRTAAPKPYEEDEPQRRSSGRQERGRSRRGRGRSAQPDSGPASSPGRRGQGPPPISAPFPVQPPARSAPPEDRATTTDPGRGRAVAPDTGYGRAVAPDTGYGRAVAPDTGYGSPATQTDRPTPRKSRRGRDADAGRDPATDPGYGRSAAAEPGHGQPAAAGWPAVADSGYQLPTFADTEYGQAPVAADPQFGQAPSVPDQQFRQAPTVADQQYGHDTAASWSPPSYDQAALAGWPAVAEPRRDEVAEAEPTGWPEPVDSRFDQGSVAGWPGADSGVGQGSVAGWPSVDSGYDQAALAGWPAVAEPRRDEVAEAEPTGWPEPEPAAQRADRGSVVGWPVADTGDGQPAMAWPEAESAFVGQAEDDSGYAQPVATAWPPAVEEEGPSAAAAPAPTRQRTARKPAPAKKAPAKKRGSAKAAYKPQAPRLLADPEPGQPPVRQLRPKRGGRLPVKVFAIAGVAAVVAAGAGAVVVFSKSGGSSGPDHTVTTPAALGSYTQQPRLAVQMRAAALREQIIKESAGEAQNVVYQVYQNGTGASGSSQPQIILFIGGNLSGTSAGSFISTFTAKLPGALTTSPGSLGGAAACVPSVDGRVAECVWADNDTFGVVASQTLSPSGLAAEMRQMRPLVEHVGSAN